MPTQLTSTEKDALARRLQSSNDEERQQAQSELKAMIADDVHRIKRNSRTANFCAIAISVFIFYIILFVLPVHRDLTIEYMTMLVLSTLVPVYLVERERMCIVRNIISLNMPQAVGPLIELYAIPNFVLSPDVRAILIRLLPRLQAADANLITLRQRKMLYNLLSPEHDAYSNHQFRNSSLSIAILSALEQIGDEKAVPVVEKLAKTAKNEEVRQAAVACLPFLQQRAEQTRAEQTLLRPNTPTTSSDTLLRPTTYTPPTEPQQLLRASHTDNNTDSA